MPDPIKLKLKPDNTYGYNRMFAECPECLEEIEDVEGVIQCEGCGVMLDCFSEGE